MTDVSGFTDNSAIFWRYSNELLSGFRFFLCVICCNYGWTTPVKCNIYPGKKLNETSPLSLFCPMHEVFCKHFTADVFLSHFQSKNKHHHRSPTEALLPTASKGCGKVMFSVCPHLWVQVKTGGYLCQGVPWMGVPGCDRGTGTGQHMEYLISVGR